MPNSNSPFGLKPVRHLLGLPMNGAVQPMYINVGTAGAMFIGDPVIKLAAGSNAAIARAPGIGEFQIGTLPEIGLAAAGATNRITGVIVAFAANPDNLQLIHRPTLTERIAFVNVDPWTVWEIQADGAIPAASMGLNANLIFTQAGSTFTGLSGTELNSATPAAASPTFQLSILKAVNRVDNDTTITRSKVEVRINLHTEAGLPDGNGI
jgi:hypothetical protein